MPADHDGRPAFYAASPGSWRDWWTLLHPPYTAWHLSYVVLGAAVAPEVDAARLGATVLAFFCAVGIAAHALDELQGRPLGTRIPTVVLMAAAASGLAAAVALGAVGVWRVGLLLVPFIVVGPLLVVGYNLELVGGRLHSDVGFAVAWGAFPVLTSYVVQAERLDVEAALAAAAAFALSYAQRSLSTRARMIRRRATAVDGAVTLDDGTREDIDSRWVLAPIERALRALSWGIVALALALVIARLT